MFRQGIVQNCVFWVSLLVFLTGGGAMAHADNFPSKPIKIYFGYKAGGSAHTSLQAMTRALETILDTPIVLIEKSGAGATIAGGHVAHAKPDGYTLGLIKSTTITTAPHELQLSYSPADDLTHLFAYAGPPSAFTVKADAQWKTWQEFIAYAKASPGQVSWTATAVTGTQYLLMQHIGKLEGIDWHGVPAKGGSEAMKLVLGGQVVGYASSGSHVSHINSGSARALLDFGAKSSLPGTPTIEEVGYKGLAIKGEPYIIVAPKGLPKEISEKLIAAMLKATQASEYTNVIKKLNMQPMNLYGEDLEKALSEGSGLVNMLLASAKK